ncbi:MAG: PD40 domain-containing protein [Actinobacteria bacterium]|nr:PD40 domain-containing protein [Actinomycetota bacterium]
MSPRISRLRVIVALVFALGAASAPPAPATLPGVDGRIAFVRPGSGIWTVNPDGSGLARVSPQTRRTSPCDSDPFFSPRGSWLVFQGCNPDRHVTNVGRMTAAGMRSKTIVTSAAGRLAPQTPTYSPSGQRIAFAAGANRPKVFIARASGGGAKSLGVVGYEPAWSSRGRIAFTVPLNTTQWCNSTELDDIATMRANGTDVRRITRDYGSYDPDWSPDGRHIAFARDVTVGPGDYSDAQGTMDCLRVHKSQAPYGPEIFVADEDGANQRQLTHAGGSHPAWSPDGKLIAFERSGYVWIMRANGKHQRRLVRGIQPAWQPLQR